MALIIILAVIGASARTKKMFPANRCSVGQENHYADAAHILRLENSREIEEGVANGLLVAIPISVNPRLPRFRRFVRPRAADFMQELDTRFYLATGQFLIVDSAVRSADIQKKLARHNFNAAPANGERASSHERGTTFDLASRKILRDGRYRSFHKGTYRWLLIQLAYYQAIGRIHVIEEGACIHIMVREDDAFDGSERAAWGNWLTPSDCKSDSPSGNGGSIPLPPTNLEYDFFLLKDNPSWLQ